MGYLATDQEMRRGWLLRHLSGESTTDDAWCERITEQASKDRIQVAMIWKDEWHRLDVVPWMSDTKRNYKHVCAIPAGK